MNFILICSLALVGYLELKKQKRQIRRLQRQLKGDKTMSKLINSLLNQIVTITTTEGIGQTWTILDSDDDWVKVQRTNKKGQVFTKLMRLDDIQSIDLKDS